MFMYMISHNATNRDLQTTFQCSGETIHRKIKEVFHIIPALCNRFVKLPNTQTHPKIASDPRFWPYFQAYPKVKKFQHKQFPLFNSLAALYEGSTATGDLNFTSVDPMAAPKSTETGDASNAQPQETINLEEDETSSAQKKTNEVTNEPFASSAHKEDGYGRKQKQNQIATVLESYLEFKKDQTKKLSEEILKNGSGTTKVGGEFSIRNCVAVLESIEELNNEKSKTLRLFKCEHNGEIFLTTKNLTVRLLWIRSEKKSLGKLMATFEAPCQEH